MSRSRRIRGHFRFSPDPLWFIDSFDLYAYAAFDPINNWDPTGMASAGIGATGQGQRSLGAPGGFGPRSQAAEEVEWARPHLAIAIKKLGESGERIIRGLGEFNGRKTHQFAEGAARRHIESSTPAEYYFYGGALFLATVWQAATPQDGDEALLDAALLTAAPIGRVATRFDTAVDAATSLGRSAQSRLATQAQRLHLDEVGSIGKPPKWIGANVTPTSSRRGGYASVTTDIKGGIDSAIETFTKLTGRPPRINNFTAKHPVDEFKTSELEIYFRPSSKSGTPSIEVFNIIEKTYEKIHFK